MFDTRGPTHFRAAWGKASGLGVVVLVAIVLRGWNLGGHEYGNLYYAAAVRSMAESWHNFFFASFDPGGFLMLDKPPVAFWIQVLAVRLLGYTGFALHLPQLLEGVASVALVYWLALRVCGRWGALLAGLVMAFTPAAVAVDRSNLPDSLLLLLLLLGAASVLGGAERGRWWGILVGTALIGIAFNVKMTVAFILLPTLYLVHVAGNWRAWKSRAAQLAVASVLLVPSSLSWALLVDLTPASSRPYVGDTTDNSVMSLAFKTLGVGRIAGLTQRLVETGTPPPRHEPPTSAARNSGPTGRPPEPLTAQGGRPGVLRLANRDMAGHITWLIPFALVGCVAMLIESRRRVPGVAFRLSILLCGGWFVSYAAAFSLSPSPVHPYYSALLGPPVAFFVGGGAFALKKLSDRSPAGSTWLILALVLTALWQVRVLSFVRSWWSRLAPVVLLAVMGATLLLMWAAFMRSRPSSAAAATGGLTIGAAALLICPAAWSLTPALAPGGRMVPIADPVLLLHQPAPEMSAENRRAVRTLDAYLRSASSSTRYLLAASDIHLLAPLVIETGAAVMAYGGFSGADPILTPKHFAELVLAGDVGFAFVVDGRRMGRMGPASEDPIAAWIREHGRECRRDEWSQIVEPVASVRPPRPWGETADIVHHIFGDPGTKLYDLSALRSREMPPG